MLSRRCWQGRGRTRARCTSRRPGPPQPTRTPVGEPDAADPAGELPVGIVGGGIVGLAIGRELDAALPGHGGPGVREGGRARHPPDRAQLGRRPRRHLLQAGQPQGRAVHPGTRAVARALPRARPALRGVRQARRRHRPRRAGPVRRAGTDRSPERRTGVAPRGGRAGSPRSSHTAAGLVALHSPATAITDYVAIARALGGGHRGRRWARHALDDGDRDREVPGAIEVMTAAGPHRVRRLVVCAGLQADRVSRLASTGEVGPRIVPFRGEYMSVVPDKRGLVRGMIYPVPDPRYPFLGVHFTRRVSGDLEVGPNAVLALAREGYRRTDVRLADVGDDRELAGLLAHGPCPLAHRCRRAAGFALGQARYMRAASRYVPEIGPDDVVRARRRRPRPGGRPRRFARRRLPHQRLRRDRQRSQRPVACRDVEPGDRRARGRAHGRGCAAVERVATLDHFARAETDRRFGEVIRRRPNGLTRMTSTSTTASEARPGWRPRTRAAAVPPSSLCPWRCRHSRSCARCRAVDGSRRSRAPRRARGARCSRRRQYR